MSVETRGFSGVLLMALALSSGNLNDVWMGIKMINNAQISKESKLTNNRQIKRVETVYFIVFCFTGRSFRWNLHAICDCVEWRGFFIFHERNCYCQHCLNRQNSFFAFKHERIPSLHWNCNQAMQSGRHRC